LAIFDTTPEPHNTFEFPSLSNVATGAARRPLQEEKELAVRATRYDQEAFGQLYDRYVTKIYQYVYYKVGSGAEAEDLTAHVFLRAWEAIGGYEWREHPFSAWLFRIARNLVVDYHRARRETVSLEGSDGRTEVQPSDEEQPDHSLQALFTSEQLRQAVSQLTDEQQEVIVLRFLEGYSTAEIAAIMGKREGAIRGLQFRGLAALRELIQWEIEDEPR